MHYQVADTGWRLTLPQGWSQRSNERGTTYFASADAAKGIYVTSWHAPNSASPDLLRRIASLKRAGLQDMDGYEWEFVMEECDPAGTRWLLDAHAQAARYRIVNIVQAGTAVCVTASFHDYDCRNYDESVAYFATTIASLRIASGGEVER